MSHELKTWPEYFKAVWDGKKPFEVRKSDRPFKAGDHFELREWNPEGGQYTGAVIAGKITYRLDGGQFGVEEGYCVLGLNVLTRTYKPLGKAQGEA